MLKKITCLCISILLASSVFLTAHAVESRTLRDVCEDEATLNAIEEMDKSDKITLIISLIYPEADKLRYQLQSITGPEFEARRNEMLELEEMYISFTEKFVKDYSLKSEFINWFSAMAICTLTIDEINIIMNDERLEGVSIPPIDPEEDEEKYDTEYLPPDDHLFEESTYIEIISGDIDGDNSVTMLDVTILQKVIAGIISDYSVTTIMDHADINGDTYFNMSDIVQMQRIIAGLI